MLLDFFSLEYGQIISPPAGGSGDVGSKGDNDKKRLQAKIAWYEAKRKLKAKEQRDLAVLQNELDALQISEELLQEPKTYAESPENVGLFADSLFNQAPAINLPAYQPLTIDLTGEDDEAEEWLLLGE